jgi:hypothetical protein
MIQARKNDESKIKIPPSFKYKMPRSSSEQPKAFNIYSRDGTDFLESYIPGFVDRMMSHYMTTKHFYQNNMSVNRPILVVHGCKDWPAMNKWQD